VPSNNILPTVPLAIADVPTVKVPGPPPAPSEILEPLILALKLLLVELY
jgi:Ni,Fe-hydrogenase III small subunit